MKRLTPDREKEIRERGYKWDQICSCGADVPELLDEVVALRRERDEYLHGIHNGTHLLIMLTERYDTVGGQLLDKLKISEAALQDAAVLFEYMGQDKQAEAMDVALKAIQVGEPTARKRLEIKKND